MLSLIYIFVWSTLALAAGYAYWQLFRYKNQLKEVLQNSHEAEQRRYDKALEEANSQLEEKVALRTQQLTDANIELSRSISVSEMTAERLKESRSFLNSVIENIPNMIFVKDAQELRFVRFNKAGEKLLGRGRAELVGKNDYDFFPKEQADFFTAKDRAVLESGVPLIVPEEAITSAEGVRYLHTRKIPIFDNSGVPQYLLGISEDITDRKIAEAQRLELVKAQAAFSEVAQSSARLKILADAGEALSESLAMESMLNSFAHVVRKHMASVCRIDFYSENSNSLDCANPDLSDMPPIDLSNEPVLSKVMSQPHGQLIKHSTSDLLCKLTGQNLDSRSLILAPLSFHGKNIGLLTLVSRGPDHVYNELDLSMAAELGRRASLAIENARLYAKAEEASRAKSAFLANISHELRTPLGAMLGFAELALDSESLTEEQVSCLNMIAKNGKALMQIVNEVLDLSKAESDLTEIELKPFSLHKLIAEVNSLLSVKADQKKLALKVEGLENLPRTVSTDPMRLRQILLNIVGNAIKFTDQGKVTLTINYRESTGQARGELHFNVTDTGIGLSEKQSQRIFEAFVQADDSTKRRFGGTGLGLFLSRKLARILGGDVVLAKSILGIGSEFHLWLPVDVIHTRPDVDLPENTRNEKSFGFRNSGRVLVVDDSEDNRILIQSVLSRIGLQVELANDGQQAFNKASSKSYDLILMDIQMPEMDGFEALRQLRANGYRRPIVALTAHAMKGDREKGIECGFDDYIYKPFDSHSIRKCLAEYLPGRSTLLH